MPQPDVGPASILPAEAITVVDFWRDAGPGRWFAKEPDFDRQFRERFLPWHEAAARGELGSWPVSAAEALALLLLLDQFPRNAFRGTPRAFASDARARSIAGTAIDRGFDRNTRPDRRFFFYLPFEHSEEAADQARSVTLFRRWADEHNGPDRERPHEQVKYALLHQKVISRFGRFPHRNAILGRESTPDEVAFLAKPDSSF